MSESIYELPTPEVTARPERVTVKTLILDEGLTVTVRPDVLDDWDILVMSEQNQFASMLARILGPEQLQRVTDHYRDPETGRLSVTVMADVMKTIVGRLSPNS